ncbi:MAG: hypothetical protein PHF46_03930 [Candidatus Gracilibacteria bacterium]|nr:hypothetical protein [Candidatus Gracilibacteria bacterium]MDD3120531.1 hypothetical protein [Candidatus Gracilibacteria bacterium]MDD4530743.1 hypothetical protein [Candidatus Gracilibacteria bacterium]
MKNEVTNTNIYLREKEVEDFFQDITLKMKGEKEKDEIFYLYRLFRAIALVIFDMKHKGIYVNLTGFLGIKEEDYKNLDLENLENLKNINRELDYVTGLDFLTFRDADKVIMKFLFYFGEEKFSDYSKGKIDVNQENYRLMNFGRFYKLKDDGRAKTQIESLEKLLKLLKSKINFDNNPTQKTVDKRKKNVDETLLK